MLFEVSPGLRGGCSRLAGSRSSNHENYLIVRIQNFLLTWRWGVSQGESATLIVFDDGAGAVNESKTLRAIGGEDLAGSASIHGW